MSQIIFYVFCALTVLPAMVAVLTRNLMRAAFSLLLTLVGVAGLYVFAGADFLAVTQLMVYVGGVVTLILFAILFTPRVDDMRFSEAAFRRIIGLIIALGLGALALAPLLQAVWKISPAQREHTLDRIGDLFLTKYLLLFEVVSVLLLAALIGAVHLVRQETKE